MVRLGKLFGILVILALTNLDLIRRAFPMEAHAFAIFAIILVGLLLSYAVVNIVPAWKKESFSRLRLMLDGECLIEIGVLSLTCNLLLGIFYAVGLFSRLFDSPSVWGVLLDTPSAWDVLLHVLLCLLISGIPVWNGLIRIYVSSVQLGIKWRVLFLLFWWVPIVHLVLLHQICKLVKDEYAFETEKRAYNEIRKVNEICKTKYPIVLVHGVFFRDRKCFNYWGRIPKELMINGASVYYGQQQSAARTKDSAEELKQNILNIIEKTGCEKVNIIAHSKGGLESRYAVSCLGLAPYVASLTTINTPHRGCVFVDWLLEKTPPCICSWLAKRYNRIMKSLGDTNPDFYAAVCDLTSRHCESADREMADAPGVFCQSVGSKMRGWSSAPFPQNLTYLLVHFFDKENDGLVGIASMKWGSRFRMASAPGHRGIGHGDMIDLNRENIPGFDVREFYVDLVRDLKEQGF